MGGVGVVKCDAIVTAAAFFEGIHGTETERYLDRFDLRRFVHEDGGGG